MTSRHDIEHIDLNAPEEEIRDLLEKNQHTRMVVTGGNEEKICWAWYMLLIYSSSRCAASR
jgi:CBS domain containing-hemolysin-like protein